MTQTNKRQLSAISYARQKRRGQGIVEFALVVPVLITLLLGIMETGWLVKTTLTINNAAREGARAAALGKTVGVIYARVQNSATPLGVTSPHGVIILRYSLNDGTDNYPYAVSDASTQNNAPVGSFVKIVVRTRHSSLTGFFPFVHNRNIEAFVTMRREAV